MKIANFDRTTLTSLRRDIDAALAKVAQETGVKLSLGAIRFSADEARATLSMKLVKRTATGEVLPNTALSKALIFHNLQVNGQNGEVLTDYVPRRHKYPFTYSKGGKLYKTNLGMAKVMFAKRENAVT